MINNEIHAMGQGRGHYLPVGPFGVYVPSGGGAWRSSIPGVDVQPNPTVPAQTVPAGPVGLPGEVVRHVEALPGLTPDQRGAFRPFLARITPGIVSTDRTGPRGSPWAEIAAATLPIPQDFGPAVPLMPGGIMAPQEAGFFDIFKNPRVLLGTAALGGMLLFLASTNNGGRRPVGSGRSSRGRNTRGQFRRR